jgi:5-methylcytosine-specific restriction endonuclease McrA
MRGLRRTIRTPPRRPPATSHQRQASRAAHLRTPLTHRNRRTAAMTRIPRPCIGNGQRPCRYHALAPKGSRCPRCASEYQKARDYGSRWRALREEILRRDGFNCHWCGGPATTVDHVTLRAAGGSDDPSNLVAACGKCNSGRNQWAPSTGRAPSPANSESPQQTARVPQQTR